MSSTLNREVTTGADELPSVERLRQMYLTMQVTTLADNRIHEEVKSGTLQATFYPVRGLEAVCAAMGAAVAPTDYLVSTYRNLGDAVAKGASLRAVIAEAYGRVTGTSKGKGGPMHLHDIGQGFMVTTGIVGSGLPMAVGLALSSQLKNDDRITVCTFGDGATSIGAFHEALNMAALWDLPIVFLCQNNQWAEHTPIAEYAANTDLVERARAYGIAARSVDGFDPIATWVALRDAAEHARTRSGPAFIEARTYRLAGHTGATDYSYMPQDEFDNAMRRDPAPTFRRWLADGGILTAEELDALDAEARDVVDDAFEFAMASPPPAQDEMFTDVFADGTRS